MNESSSNCSILHVLYWLRGRERHAWFWKYCVRRSGQQGRSVKWQYSAENRLTLSLSFVN